MRVIFSFPLPFIAVIALIVFGCAGDLSGPDKPPGDPDLGNALFPGTNLIQVGIPAFSDTVSATPEFTWVATGKKLVYLGIFSGSIDVKANQIANIGDNIWAWNSGIGAAREGDVKYSEGFDVINGELQKATPPTALTSGNQYFWAVWAWDDRGTAVTHSSQEMYFVVQQQ